MNDETSGFIGLCNLPRYLVAIQGTTMKCRQEKKNLLSSCQDCTPHPKTRKQRDRKTLGADPCTAHPWMRAQQTNCKNTHDANYRCLGILKGDGGSLPEPRHSRAKMSQEHFITGLISTHSRWRTAAFRMGKYDLLGKNQKSISPSECAKEMIAKSQEPQPALGARSVLSSRRH